MSDHPTYEQAKRILRELTPDERHKLLKEIGEEESAGADKNGTLEWVDWRNRARTLANELRQTGMDLQVDRATEWIREDRDRR